MLENPSDTAVKRNASPSQRNRTLSRRKSGGLDRFERVYSHGTDGEKSHMVTSTVSSAVDHGEAVQSNPQNEGRHPVLIPIDGCCRSDASQLMHNRWAAAIHSYNDPSLDLSERPVMYSGASSGSAWGQSKLPQQIDFLAELRRAIRNANVLSNTRTYN